ncbi:TPA: hemolysin [Vibrio parahaemolyticus]|nr:hemolysin [Vibrio parahaemolyticus]HAS6621314.1 hemolysin [Vibrio parahaemolyticus]HAS6631847.1 hemolysin [Vibrio parahaemolyticus]HAS6648343.1 hemolysin [Vibrio parahaemolyticus]HAS6653395.1 hemolysin [Vibrio parahaemolyticus]
MLINKIKTVGAIIPCLLINSVYADISKPQGQAIGILSSIYNDSQVRYINASNWLKGSIDIPSLAIIREDIINNRLRYFIDFSTIEDELSKKTAKSLLRKKIGLSFISDFLIISPHKDELLFTPLDNDKDPNISLLEADKPQRTLSPRVRDFLPSTTPSGSNSLPHVAFYLNVNRTITDQECSFPKSHLWDNGDRVFCDNPNISLIYRVNLERSLQYGTTGAATPDAKIVRISLDDDTTGAGIHLNDYLDYEQIKIGGSVLNAYSKEWSTNAIAQDYQFTFNASNNKAQILKTFPRENLNKNYEVKEVSGFQLGVTGGIEANKDGPKGKLEANASYDQSRWLTFNTHDYRVERNTANAQNIQFKWSRDQYATAESLLDRSTDAFWVDKYPVDVNKINPIGYASFVPKMDVIYMADPNARGTTDFTIDSSVNIRPIYHAAYNYYYILGGHQSYYGFENSPRRRVSKSASFTVDWDHPVFTGGRPVNLQLGSFNNRCIDVGYEGTIKTSNCDETKYSQSFIYDQLGRYVSASDVNKCLDGISLDRLQNCNSNLSQRWEWEDGSDHLRSIFSGQLLGHDNVSGDLGLYAAQSREIGLRTVTSFTNVFNTINESTVFGSTSGLLAQQEFNDSNVLYIRHGAAINAIGTQPENLHGGKGGLLSAINLNQVKQIEITSGELYGSTYILTMTFSYNDGSKQIVGSREIETITHDEVFELIPGTSIQKIKVWSSGWLVDGVQFVLNQ